MVESLLGWLWYCQYVYINLEIIVVFHNVQVSSKSIVGVHLSHGMNFWDDIARTNIPAIAYTAHMHAQACVSAR